MFDIGKEWLTPHNPKDYMMGSDVGGILLTGFDTGEKGSGTVNPSTLRTLGLFTAVTGALTSAIGNFYAAKSAQLEQESKSESYRFASHMASLNASAAEKDAQSILEAGHSQIANYTMEAGQRKASMKTSTAARGVVLGQGSARDVEASMDVVKDIDVLTINSNAVRAAESQRMQEQNYQNQALLYGVSADNARRSARSISPKMSMFSSLLGSATRIAQQWNADSYMRNYGYRR